MKVLCILLFVTFASGFYIDNNETHEDKIIEGDYVRIEDVPYQASLLLMRVFNFCGATIIHESWVVTAAHCVHNKSHISVRTGSGYRETVGKVHRVEKIIMHADFGTNANSNNDIALIMLAEPIQFNNKQQPIELAKPHDIPKEGELMKISGFGKIGSHLWKSDFLMATYVPVVNQENCERVYRLDPITDNMFCAGNGNANMCNGDSGGPGVIHNKLYGIISTVIHCKSKIFPGVYTRVHKYYNWIREKTGLIF